MTIPAPLEKSLEMPNAPIWRLSVEQYHQMIDKGILTDDDLVELLAGWLVTKMPKTPLHSLSKHLTREILSKIMPSGWHVDSQVPITTLDSEPEPDVIIVKGNRRDFLERHPHPHEVALVVEVSDATLQRDRTLKMRLYASARIAIYWILNLPDRQLEVYLDPLGADEQVRYRAQHIYHESDTVPVIIDGQEIGQIQVRNLLP